MSCQACACYHPLSILCLSKRTERCLPILHYRPSSVGHYRSTGCCAHRCQGQRSHVACTRRDKWRTSRRVPGIGLCWKTRRGEEGESLGAVRDAGRKVMNRNSRFWTDWLWPPWDTLWSWSHGGNGRLSHCFDRPRYLFGSADAQT